MKGKRPGAVRDNGGRRAKRTRDPALRLERARRVERHAARVARELALYRSDHDGQMYLFDVPTPAAK